ncbi:hypothetical protein [Cytobacillus oceanisediminis]|nr:hypothetical protein [Cytobacillus oceanisediminis]USK42379.1 hypothetical protein LIT27_17260 [Cytobacillus oceanisediminis]
MHITGMKVKIRIKNILDSIKGFFDEADHAGNGDESNTGDSDDGGDDGGE